MNRPSYKEMQSHCFAFTQLKDGYNGDWLECRLALYQRQLYIVHASGYCLAPWSKGFFKNTQAAFAALVSDSYYDSYIQDLFSLPEWRNQWA